MLRSVTGAAIAQAWCGGEGGGSARRISRVPRRAAAAGAPRRGDARARRLHSRVRGAEPAARTRRPVVRAAGSLGAGDSAGDEPRDLRARAAPARAPAPRPQAPAGAARVGHARRASRSLAGCDRSVDRIEADMLGDLPPETVEVVRRAMASFAHSLGGDQPAAPSAAARSARGEVTARATRSLFAGLFAHGDVAAAVSDRALVDAMVEFEVALLRALAVLGARPGRGGATSSSRRSSRAFSSSTWPSSGAAPASRARRSRRCSARCAGSCSGARPRTCTRARRARTWSTPR